MIFTDKSVIRIEQNAVPFLGVIKPFTLAEAKTKGRYFHTLWTSPVLSGEVWWQTEDQLTIYLIYMAASLHSLKTAGQEVVLYTDTLGAKLCKHLGYDEIYVELENLPYPNILWAAGKIVATNLEHSKGYISTHVDTDVVFTNPTVIDIINICPMVISHYESMQPNREILLKAINELGMGEFFNGNEHSAVNCGVVKINHEIAEEFFKRYSYLAQLVPRSDPEHRYLSLDLVIEQLNLYTCKGIDDAHLLVHCDPLQRELGYFHCFGTSKNSCLWQIYKLLQETTMWANLARTLEENNLSIQVI